MFIFLTHPSSTTHGELDVPYYLKCWNTDKLWPNRSQRKDRTVKCDTEQTLMRTKSDTMHFAHHEHNYFWFASGLANVNPVRRSKCDITKLFVIRWSDLVQAIILPLCIYSCANKTTTDKWECSFSSSAKECIVYCCTLYKLKDASIYWAKKRWA